MAGSDPTFTIMKPNFTEIAFTQSVKKAQEKYGSREIYKKMDGRADEKYAIYHRERAFIAARDSFYMATVNEDGWPYVQFRGGPKGFLKVIDDHTLGFADFRGNMQYISTGNINHNQKAALILLDYPTRTRLKVWAETEVLDPLEHPELTEKLIDSDYGAVVERLMIFHIKAADWNCPQHIPQRYTLEEIEAQLPLEYEKLKNLGCEND